MLGYLTGLMTTLKGLPSTYDKDLQEDKVPVFNAYDMLIAILPVLAGTLRSLSLHPERMQAAIDPSMMATDLADYLVNKGIPFREAHNLASQAFRLAGELGKPLDMLSLQEFQVLNPLIGSDVYAAFDPKKSIARRCATGGTAVEAVRAQLQRAKNIMEKT